MNGYGRSIAINILYIIYWSQLFHSAQGYSALLNDSSKTTKDGVEVQKENFPRNVKLKNDNNEYANTTETGGDSRISNNRRFVQRELPAYEFDYYIPITDRLTPENAEKYFQVQAKLQKVYDGDLYNEDEQFWENMWQNTILALDIAGKVKHMGEHSQTILACHMISVSYLNAIMDIKDYYKLRYLYANNLDYEVGFLVHEIIFRYQTVLELFAIARNKYENKTVRFFAPTTLMLYMYTHVLDECKQIIHLCNMLHEIEKKYLNVPKTAFTDYHLPDERTRGHGQITDKYVNAAEKNQKLLEKLERKRLRDAQKRQREMAKSGKLFTTTRKPQKRKKNRLIYGWSIEYW